MVDRIGVPGIDYLNDNADEALAAIPCMPTACAACPARDGTEACADRITGPMFRECVAERHAFFCHLTKAGPLEMPTHLCGGWAQAIGATNG